MLSHKALYNVTTNTKNIRTVVCANTKGHLLGTSLTWNLTIPNLILDPPLTRNLTIPCLFYVKNVFHRASSRSSLKTSARNFKEMYNQIKSTFHATLSGEGRLGRLGVEALSITLTELGAIGDTRR